MNITVSAQSFPIAGTFTISRGSKTTAETIMVEVAKSGFTGRGEAVPYARYGESVNQCVAALHAAEADINTGVFPPHLP